MNEAELLARIATTMRQEIGPAVDGEYPKTQAFMIGVVLQKLSRQLALAPSHAQAEAEDMDALIADLNQTYTTGAVQKAIAHLWQARDPAALCALIETLYASREDIGDGQFSHLLGRVRQSLRATINRTLEYAE